MNRRLASSRLVLAALVSVACTDAPGEPALASSNDSPGAPASSGSGGETAPLAGRGGGGYGGYGGATAVGGGSSSSGASGASGHSGLGGVAGGVNLNMLAEAFDGFRMDLPCDHPQENPCEPQNSATPNRGYLCCYVDETIERENRPPADVMLGFGGDPALTYDVELRVRGVVENRDYGNQGTKVGEWLRVGGALPEPGAIHVFGATVAEPAQTYFFNSWNDTSKLDRLVSLDYLATLRLRGGTTVRLFEYDDIGKIWSNAGGLKVEGIEPYPAAPEGQFMQLNVVSVRPRLP